MDVLMLDCTERNGFQRRWQVRHSAFLDRIATLALSAVSATSGSEHVSGCTSVALRGVGRPQILRSAVHSSPPAAADTRRASAGACRFGKHKCNKFLSCKTEVLPYTFGTCQAPYTLCTSGTCMVQASAGAGLLQIAHASNHREQPRPRILLIECHRLLTFC